jgi:hypothetical protein
MFRFSPSTEHEASRTSFLLVLFNNVMPITSVIATAWRDVSNSELAVTEVTCGWECRQQSLITNIRSVLQPRPSSVKKVICKRQIYPLTGPDRPLVMHKVEAHKVARWSAQSTGRLYPQGDNPGTYFCRRLSQPHGNSAAGRIQTMKHPNDRIGKRTRDLPACSGALQPTAPTRARKGYLLAVPTLVLWCLSIHLYVQGIY